MKNSYVQAFTKSILTGTEVGLAIENLKAALTRRGHLRLFSQVLKAARRELEVRLKSDAPQVSIAHSDVVSKEVIADALAKLGSSEAPHVTVDATLVGGFTARVKDSFLDASYKRRLLNLYRHIARGNQ